MSPAFSILFHHITATEAPRNAFTVRKKFLQLADPIDRDAVRAMNTDLAGNAGDTRAVAPLFDLVSLRLNGKRCG